MSRWDQSSTMTDAGECERCDHQADGGECKKRVARDRISDQPAKSNALHSAAIVLSQSAMVVTRPIRHGPLATTLG